MVNINNIILESHKDEECKCRQRKPSFIEKLEDQLNMQGKLTFAHLDVTQIPDPIKEYNEPSPPPSSPTSSTTDFIGDFLGPIGKWQIRTILLIYLCKIPSSWFMACIIFTAPALQHGEIFCKPPVSNMSETEWIKIAHHIKERRTDQEYVMDYCNIREDALDHVRKYLNRTNNFNDKADDFDLFNISDSRQNKLVPCEAFEEHPVYTSIITQFDLYCSREILIAVTQFFHLFGVLCGGIVTTYMMKYIEPRKCMLIGMLTQILCGNLTGWANMFELHMFFRCLSAVCCGLMYTAGGLIFTDITSGKYKIIAVCMFEQFWSIGLMLLPAVASHWSSWTYLYMAISFPTIVLIGLYPWIPNSPRWMIQRGRIQEAKEILLDAARVNGKIDFSIASLEKQLQIQAADCLKAPKEPSYWQMWKGQSKNLIFVHLSWSVYIVIYYGFLLNIRNFGRQYLEENTIICGVCEIIGTFIGLWLIFNTQRKWLYTSIFNIIASFISLSAHLIPPDVTSYQRMILLMITSMASKISISTTLSILMTCTTEIVSPEKRRLCGYTSTIWTRIWLLTAPFVGATAIVGQLVPQTFLSLLNILGSLFTSIIDTPQTIQKKQSDEINHKDFYPKEIPIPEVWLSSYKQYNH